MPITEIPVTGMLSGFPGTLANIPGNVVCSYAVNSGSAAVNWGGPVIFNSAGDFSVNVADSTLTISNFAGIAVRQVELITNFLSPNTTATYPAGKIIPVLTRGRVSVTCQLGTPSPFNGVYVRVATNSALPGMVIGGFEAESATDGSNTVLITNARWCGVKDANGTVTVELINPANA
jgi:hypothetical protein